MEICNYYKAEATASKCKLLTGDTKPHKDELKKIGRWNHALKGWFISNKNEKLLEEWINTLPPIRRPKRIADTHGAGQRSTLPPDETKCSKCSTTRGRSWKISILTDNIICHQCYLLESSVNRILDDNEDEIERSGVLLAGSVVTFGVFAFALYSNEPTVEQFVNDGFKLIVDAVKNTTNMN